MSPDHKKLHSQVRRQVRKSNKGRPFTRRKVLKMLAVMEPQETPIEAAAAAAANATHSQEFLTTGRTGRRNALPDILGEHAVVSSADLPARLQNLSTSDASSSGCSGSSEASTSKQPNITGS